MTTDDLVLKINGQNYQGWTEARVTRALKECASSFDFSVTERWAGRQGIWQIRPFDKAEVTIGGQTVLTGYVEHYNPAYDKDTHAVRVAGRSKTCDIVDCMPDVSPGEYDGYTLDKVAKALAAPFGIDVVVECDMGAAFPDVTLEKTETAFQLLEKLARARGVIVTDNAKGNLVLTQAGKKKAVSSLTEGENILYASAKLAVDQRFQKYVVLSQTPLAYDGDDARIDGQGCATDGSVPRFRRFAEMSENPLDDDLAKKRAAWRARHECALGTEATIAVVGYRQKDAGDLWDTNLLIPVNSPMLAMKGQFLIGKVSYTIDGSGGSRTELTVAPPDAFTPDPGDGGIDSSDAAWTGVKKISP